LGVESEPPKIFSMIHKFSKTLPKFKQLLKNEFRKKMGISFYSLDFQLRHSQQWLVPLAY